MTSIDKDTFEKEIINKLKSENGQANDQRTVEYIYVIHEKRKFNDEQLYQLIYTMTNIKKTLLHRNTIMKTLLHDISKMYKLSAKCVDLLLESPQMNGSDLAWFDGQINIHAYMPTKAQLEMLIGKSYRGSLKLALQIYGDDDVCIDTLTDIIRNRSYEDHDLLYCLQTSELSIPKTTYKYITHALPQDISTHIVRKQEYSNEALQYIMTYYNVEPVGTYIDDYYDKSIQFNGNDVLSVIANINTLADRDGMIVNIKHMLNYVVPMIQHKITSEEFLKIYEKMLKNADHFLKYTINLMVSTGICKSQYMENFLSSAIRGSDTTVAKYIISANKNIPEKCTEYIVSTDNLVLILHVLNMKIIPAQHLVKHIKSLAMFNIFVLFGLCVNSDVMSIMLKKNIYGFNILECGFIYDLDMYNLYCTHNVFETIKDGLPKIHNAFGANIPDYELRHNIYFCTLPPDVSVVSTRNIDCHMYGQLFKNYSKYENIILACEKKYKYVPTLKLAAYIKEPETRKIIIDKIKSAYENLPKELLL